jgi:RNA polymerase sigma-70 factor, ECF subfamily
MAPVASESGGSEPEDHQTEGNPSLRSGLNDGGSMSSSLSQWVDEHGDALYRYAVQRVRDRHAVEDILQETFLAALKSEEAFRGEAAVRTWLVSILRLKIVDYYRRVARSKTLQQIEEAELESRFVRESRLDPWDASTGNTFENEEFWGVFRGCLEKLPASLGQVYLLREIDQCAPETICESFNISRKNLAVRIFRARAALRDCLDRNWFGREGR